jgi:maltose/moltooligosaccharide transporter
MAWASILSMPYSILSTALPQNKMGIYMGIFNFFIVIPEILSALFFGWVMAHLLGNDRMKAVVVGGVCFVIAALLTQRVHEAIPIDSDERVPSAIPRAESKPA